MAFASPVSDDWRATTAYTANTGTGTIAVSTSSWQPVIEWVDDSNCSEPDPDPSPEDACDEDKPRRPSVTAPIVEPRPEGVRDVFPRPQRGGQYDPSWPRPPP